MRVKDPDRNTYYINCHQVENGLVDITGEHIDFRLYLDNDVLFRNS